ncbi:DUF6152 family protein [Uliginosibacterium sp. H3]|uniref:DUF6152 family protein n=1 Tax=Uliginosibacterium silvisoli TaxID=3114758 RepID=A0ABU6K3D9_9RHOO|nr:DUF6152 family protein [Uliginosibacterium sp. H3]
MQRRDFVFGMPLLLASGSALAHHGWSGFDETRPLYLAGKVVEVEWQNPHAELILQLNQPLAVPASLKSRTAPAQSAGIDAGPIFARAVVPTRRDEKWEIELSPLTRLSAWKVPEVKVGEELELVGYTFAGEKGDAVLRAEYLIRGNTVTPLRSSPA